MAVNLEKLPAAVETLVRMGANKVILFGGAAVSPERASDIDLAVEGIPPERILDADVALMEILGQSFDLVSRDLDPEFFDIATSYGKILHG